MPPSGQVRLCNRAQGIHQIVGECTQQCHSQKLVGDGARDRLPTPRARSPYTYDGIQELTGAAESPGSSFAYVYDPAGNRTAVKVNGTQTASYAYNAANEVQGWSYDAAGNLTSDGVTSYSFDALGRLSGTTATGQTRAYAYNGDGTLVSATANGATSSYAQDLAGGQSQVLGTTSGGVTSDYLYGDGSDRLASLTSGTRTWYGTDNQGSVRQSLSDATSVLGTQNYDPYGNPEGGTTPSTFGYTGELQDASTSAVYLRARWYQPGTGTLLGVAPLVNQTGQAYGYAGDNPVNSSDPSGLDASPTPTATPCASSAASAQPSPNAAPTPTNGSDAINRLLENVRDAWTTPIEAGDWNRPGNQYAGFYIGTEVHRAIAAYYRKENPNDNVYSNSDPMSRILADKELKGEVDASVLSKTHFKMMPDILNVTQRTIYEIKPYYQFEAAVSQLYAYYLVFKAARIPMDPGPIAASGTQGIVAAPGGYAVFAAPSSDVILYRKYNGSFKPGAQEATAPGNVSIPVTIQEVTASGATAASLEILIWVGSNPEVIALAFL